MGAALHKHIEDINFAYVLVPTDENNFSISVEDHNTDSRIISSNPNLELKNSAISPFSSPLPKNRHDKRRSKKLANMRPVKFSQLSSISRIGMCGQGLIKISTNVGLLGDRAEILQVCCNSLKTLPVELGYLSNLKVLSISHNKIKALPDSIGFMVNLIELRAADNNIKTLPRSIAALTKLNTLILNRNMIERVPEEIGFLENLVTLDLSDNPLDRLPAEINRLKYLRYLTLNDCPLAVFNDSWPHNKDFKLPVMSLKEISARVIVRHDLSVSAFLSPMLQDYLKSVHECSFCGGPYFETFTVRGKLLKKGQRLQVPLEYRLCCNHWSSEEERLEKMFQGRPSTSPPAEKGPHFTSQLFNAFSPLRRRKAITTQIGKDNEEPSLFRSRSCNFPRLDLHSIEGDGYSAVIQANDTPVTQRKGSFSSILKKEFRARCSFSTDNSIAAAASPSFRRKHQHKAQDTSDFDLISLDSLATLPVLPKIKVPAKSRSNPNSTYDDSDAGTSLRRTKSLFSFKAGASPSSSRGVMKKSKSDDLFRTR